MATKKRAATRTPRKSARAKTKRAARSADLVLQHRETIARRYLQGALQSEIAVELEISLATVKRDLVEIRNAWQNSTLRDFDELKGEQLARIDAIEAEAWEMWMRSKEKIVRVVEEDIGVGKFTGDNRKTTTDEGMGEPRYLAIILQCVERRSKLLGLDSPQKVAPTNPAGDQPYTPARDLSPEERRARIVELTKKLEAEK